MASRAIKQDKDSKEVRVVQKPAKLTLMLAIAAATLILGAGGGLVAWYFVRVQDGAAPKQKPSVFASPETFTANLQPEHSEQHLQTNATLKVADAN